MKVCFLVPDGTGLRNYLYSHVIDHFSPNDEIIVWTTLSDEVVDQVANLHGRSVDYFPMDQFIEPFMCKLIKEAVTYARLRYNTRIDKNQTTMINWTRKKYRGTTKLFFQTAAMLGWLTMGSYRAILILEKIYNRLLSGTDYVKHQQSELKKMGVDVIFCTHQRSGDAAAIVHAANLSDIPTVGAIYSWDNLPKARLLVQTQKFVVWSNYMRDEMHRYYPEISNDRIVVTGTPQFEFYFDREMYFSKEAFCKRQGLDPSRKIICFSGNDLTFPCDDLYLNDLAEALMTIDEHIRPQILLRRCPVDLSGRFEKIILKFPDLIKVSDPLWKKYKNGWDAIVPTPEDVALLVNVSLHADVVINVGSTMAHDFAVFDKPAIYINYDQPTVPNWSAVTNNLYQQFQSMPDGDCVIWLNKKEDIARLVMQSLDQPDRVAVSRQKWLQTVVSHPLIAASEKIAKVCQHEVKSKGLKKSAVATVSGFYAN
jgi:hypothetical protein